MITINKTPNADSRAGGMEIDISDLERSTEDHIEHVAQGLTFFADKIMEAAGKHDYTKLANMEDFHHTITTLTPGNEVKASPWYKMHITKERHHLNSHVADDVNLVDILEFITDCVMAGMSRTGTLSDISVPAEVLQKAFNNTVDLLKSQVEVTDDGSANS